MSGIISKHILSIQVIPYRRVSKDDLLPQVIAFKEDDKYYLAGLSQIARELKALLPEIEARSYRSILATLEVRTGTQLDAAVFADFLAKIKVLPEAGE